ncbi:Olfactory receptor 56 [Lemmus lemmus]
MVMFLVALSGNGLMILLILVDSHLHSPMYFFLSWLSLMDLMLISTIVPRMAADFLMGRGSISFTGCGLQILFFLTLLGDECFLLAFMAYDRYVAISNPLRYSVVMSRRVCWFMVAGSWLFGLVDGLIQAVFTLRFPYCGSQEIDHFFCEVPAVLKLACADTSLYETMIYVCCVLMLLLPFSVISASYLRILVAVLRMRSAEGRQKAFATCSSHMMVVSLFYGAAMITYMRPQAYHSSKQDKVVSAFYTPHPNVQPTHLQPEEQGCNQCLKEDAWEVGHVGKPHTHTHTQTDTHTQTLLLVSCLICSFLCPGFPVIPIFPLCLFGTSLAR